MVEVKEKLSYAKKESYMQRRARESRAKEGRTMTVTETEIPREVHTPTGIYYEYSSGQRVKKSGGGGGMVVGIQQTQAKQQPVSATVTTEKSALVTDLPPAISSAYSGQVTQYKQSWWESTKQSFSNAPVGLSMAGKGLVEDFDVSKGFQYIFQPFKYSGKQIKETKYPYNISPTWRGTEIQEGQFDPYKSTKDMTYEEVEERGYPSGISEDIYARTGTRVSRVAPAVAETGVIIGASLTGAGGGAIVSGYLVGSGMGQTVKAETTTERLVGVGTVGLGLVGMGAVTQNIARSVDVARLESLQAKKLKIAGQELVRGDKGSLYVITGKKSVGTAKLTTTMKMPVFQTGDDIFSITGGKGISKIKYFSFEKAKWVTGKETYGFFGKGTISSTGTITKKGVTFALKDWQMAWGKGGIIRGKEMTSFGFGGATKDSGFYYTTMGGKLKAGRFSVAKGTRKGIFNVEGVGFIKKYQPTEVKKIWVSSGKKSSEQFIKQLYAPTVKTFGDVSTKQFIAQVTPSITKKPLINLGAWSGSQKPITKTKIAPPIVITKTLKKPPIVEDTTTKPVGDLTFVGATTTITPTVRGGREGVIPIVIPKPDIIERPEQPQPSIPIIPPPFVPSIIPTSPLFIPPIIPSLFPKLGLSERGKTRRFKAPRRYKYQPSFSAIVFDIRGKIPTGREMGTRIRPIPKGYSYAFKMPKFNMPKFNFGYPKKRKRRKKK